ncbi:hypothetical protein FHG87_017897 [Trinorchestia longiramus]|nr:hypothetical protein FHG87_017897 [Trinorchestia longiramus]
MGTFTPRVLPPFPADHLSLWLSLSEGLLLPLLLLTDRTFRSAVSAACRRGPRPAGTSSSGSQSFKDGEAPFRLFPKDDAKVFPLTNGSLFSSLLSLPVEAPPPPPISYASPTYRKDERSALHMGLPGAAFRALDLRRLAGTAPTGGHGEVPYNAPYYCRDLHNSLTSLANNPQDPLYSNPNNNVSTIDSSMKEDHIYATLSETFGSMSSFSDGFLNDDNRCPSVTTVANDDFEFHDPRTSGCSIDYYPLKDRNPCLRQQSCSSSSFSSSSELLSYRPSVKEDTLVLCHPRKSAPRNIGRRPPAELPPEALNPNLSSTNEHCSRPFSNGNKSPPKVPMRNHETDFVTERNRQNVMNSIEEETISKQKLSTRIGYDNVSFESDTLEKKYYMQKHATDSIKSTKKLKPKSRHYDSDNLDGTLSRKHRVSSLSMSDLDQLERKSAEDDEDQMMFLLPVKSESMLSLYRLYLAEDEESSTSLHYSIEVSKSENDLSVAWHGQNHSNGGRTKDDMSSPHEIYQKRRRPQSSASKVRRQHKIQRAKGVHLKSKPPSPVHRSHEDDPHKDARNLQSISQPLGVTFGDHVTDGGMRVAIVDKTRRQNGIITIRDPSGLSVRELFSVLNRAATSPSPGDSSEKNSLNQSTASRDHSKQLINVIPTYNNHTSKPSNSTKMRSLDKKDTVIAVPAPDSDSRAAGTTHEFRKIFLSEYL